MLSVIVARAEEDKRDRWRGKLGKTSLFMLCLCPVAVLPLQTLNKDHFIFCVQFSLYLFTFTHKDEYSKTFINKEPSPGGNRLCITLLSEEAFKGNGSL